MTIAPGTQAVVWTPGTVGIAIRYFTKSMVNHAFTVYFNDEVIEAHAPGVVVNPNNYAHNPKALFATDLMEYLEQKRPGIGEQLAKSAAKYIGTPYGFLDIFAIFLKLEGHDWKWLDKRIMSTKTGICSQINDMAANDIGLHYFNDGRLPNLVTPEDLFEVYFNPDKWEQIVVD